MSIFRKKIHAVDKDNLPRHIGIIMDGNGRWAKKRGMPRMVGHRAGANTLKTITTFCDEIGIQALTVYAFSTENWKRPKNEVANLMSLLAEYLSKAEEELSGKNVVIKVIGDVKPFDEKLRRLIDETQELTKNNTGNR